MAVVTNYTIYSEKQANTVTVDTSISIFTKKADIKTSGFGIFVLSDDKTLHLNNNITIKNTPGFVGLYGITDTGDNLTIVGNNTAKKTISTQAKNASDSEVFAKGILVAEDKQLNIGGSTFFYNFTASAQNTGNGKATAAGIETPELVSDAVFKGNFTITAKTNAGDATATGISATSGFSAQAFSGNFKITAESKSAAATAYGLKLSSWSGDDQELTGSVTITAKAGTTATAYGIFSDGTLRLDSITKAINVTAKGAQVDAAAVSGYSITLSDKVSGKITVNANITDENKNSDIAGIKATTSTLRINDLASAITVKTTGVTAGSNVNGIYAEGGITIYGDYNGKLTVSGKSKSTDTNKYDVYGIQSGDSIAMQDITGAWNIANTGSSDAFGLFAEKSFNANNISGSKTVTSKEGAAYGFKSNRDTISVASVSGTVTIKGKQDAAGFSAKQNILIDDAAKLDLKVTSSTGTAQGFAATDSNNSNITIANLSKLTVSSSDGKAYGLNVSSGAIDLRNVTGNKSITSKNDEAYAFFAENGYFFADKISGKITVKGNSTTGYAAGIWANAGQINIIDATKMNLNVTNSSGDAYGINGKSMAITNGLNVGKITVNGKYAYGIFILDDISTSGTPGNHRISGTITAKSKDYSAYGIKANQIGDDAAVSATINTTGATDAYGVYINKGNLTLDGAKITAKVTDKKYADNAYAVFAYYEESNTVTITGNSKITGHIRLGDNTLNTVQNTVQIYHGSSVKGGMSGVDKLELYVNDAGKKNTALWNITADMNSTGADFNANDITLKEHLGLTGKFKLFTKTSALDWNDLIGTNGVVLSNLFGEDYDLGESIYDYNYYAAGNNFFAEIKVKTDSDRVIDKKLNTTQSLQDGSNLFTAKANINVKDQNAIETSSTNSSRVVVLDNSITASGSVAELAAVKDNYILSVYAGNAAKTVKVTNKTTSETASASAAYGYCVENTDDSITDEGLTFGGGKFQQNITVSITVSNTHQYAASDAYGIYTTGFFTSNAVMTGNITVTNNTSSVNGGITAGIYTFSGTVTIQDITKTLKVTSTADPATTMSFVYGISGIDVSMDRLSGKINVTAKNGNTMSDAFGIEGDYISIGAFTGTITTNAAGIQQTAGIYAGSTSTGKVELLGNNTGSITVTAKAPAGASTLQEKIYAAGIYAESNQTYSGVNIGSYSGALTVKSSGSTADDFNTYGIYATKLISINNDFSGKLNVSASKNTGSNNASYGFYSEEGNIWVTDISGKLNVSNDTADAKGVFASQGISFTDLSGSVTVTSKQANAYGLEVNAANGDFTANTISGKITVKGKERAYGIYAGKGANVGSASKMNMTVTATTGVAYGVYAENGVMNGTLGKISVTSTDGAAYGVQANVIELDDITGNISVTSKKLNATAFHSSNGRFSAGTISGKITVNAKNAAVGIRAVDGEISISDASKMNMTVKSSGDKATGIDTDDSLKLASDLNLGKITVNANTTATGVKFNGITYGGGAAGCTISGTITATAKNNAAYGLNNGGSFNNTIVSATINATGKTTAYGIQYADGNLTLDGAKITAKVTDKNYAKEAKAVEVTGNGTIEIQNGSKLTGNISFSGTAENDKVVIESGSKLSGALVGVEVLELEINDVTQRGKTLWDATADYDGDGSAALLQIDFETGMTGDFQLVSKKSNLSWDELLMRDVCFDFDGNGTWGGDGETLSLSDAADPDKKYSSSCSYDGYDYELKAKGNKLILSVTESKEV